MILQGQARQIYTTFTVVSIAAMLWLVWNVIFPHQQIVTCPFHAVTGIGCPSCGVTRSVLSIAGFEFTAAWNYNPLGFPVFVMLLLVPPLIAYDLLQKEQYFFRLYTTMESVLRRRKTLTIFLVALVLVNWYFKIK